MSTESAIGVTPKPLLRGWLHAGAAVGAIVLTVALCGRSSQDLPRFLSMLVFGLSMVELFAVSAIYHIGKWRPAVHSKLRAVDHANIFILIAGTYTPVFFNALTGWIRPTFLAAVWILALMGIALAAFTIRWPRWVGTSLYIIMGWVSVLAVPALLETLTYEPILVILLGGVAYTLGAVVYALKKPNPSPRIFGFHEIFHLLVVLGAALDAAAIWAWILPLPRT